MNAPRVVATAGHVDHGKSTLIRVLTGTDPDRFPEERARGLTIDLGYAFSAFDEFDVGFVDVPGHTKFIRNMLSGVGAVEVALLVVAANEGWMPQSQEHAEILELFGVRSGIVALTKADTVDRETVEYATLELAESLRASPLTHWPVIAVDSISGHGIEELRTELARALRAAPAPLDQERPRLWVDRAFSARGAGTIVTGTLTHGALTVDDDVTIVPAMINTRIRGMQSGHSTVSTAPPGSRVALNLANVDVHDIARGAAIVRARDWHTTQRVGVHLTTLHEQRLNARARINVHVGSAELECTWSQSRDDETLGILTLPVPAALQPGDRLVLRSTARGAIVAGGLVLDVEPPRHGLRAHRCDVEEVVLSAPWSTMETVCALGGFARTQCSVDLKAAIARDVILDIEGEYLHRSSLDALCRVALEQVREHHRLHPEQRGAPLATITQALGIEARQARRVIAHAPELVVDADLVRTTDHVGAASDTPEGRLLLAALEAAPFTPPDLTTVGVTVAVAKRLVREGFVEEHDGIYFAATAIEQARTMIGAAVVAQGSLTVSQIRDILGSTRKYVLPIVKMLDASGVTRRRGDDRIPGPRASR